MAVLETAVAICVGLLGTGFLLAELTTAAISVFSGFTLGLLSVVALAPVGGNSAGSLSD